MKGIKITQSITDRQDESLKSYFRDVSKIPLLNQDEEIELGRKAINGDKFAIDKLIVSNLRFAISVAKQYQNRGLPLVDLIQAANEGLIQCITKFNPDKGCKFISFAVWWIRQSIIKALLENGKTIRIPTSKLSCINKISKATEEFIKENCREPSITELENITNFSAEKIISTLATSNKFVSLDNHFRGEDTSCLLDIIPDNEADIKDDNLTKTLENILNTLPSRDSDVMKMYFGIGMNAIPNDVIAEYFGVGTERIRQIIKTSLKYLRKNYSTELKKLI